MAKRKEHVRVEKDSMGPVRIPAEALWGPSTQRAVENFPISGLAFGRAFIKALAEVKLACLHVNRSLKVLPLSAKEIKSIEQAILAVRDGNHDDQFLVDIFQTGSGTSTNMNANEVIATLASRRCGKRIHPNDHVNASQSSNDVIPTALHVAAAAGVEKELLPELKKLARAFEQKARSFAKIPKTGRTHLQDATPVTLGQEFSGYAEQIRKGHERINATLPRLRELPIGGTAVGTGVNAPKGFGRRVAAELSRETGIKFREAKNHFEAQGARDACVELSGALKTLAVSLTKISNDLRWLACGPRCGLSEISLPSLQPGSSIMPGKINPVIPESTLQVCAQVIGNDAAVTWGGAGGNFELNVMMPLIARNILESITLLTNACRNLRERCVEGITANTEQCRETIERNLALATLLVPVIGYDAAAALSKRAFAANKSIRETALEEKILDPKTLDKLLDIKRML